MDTTPDATYFKDRQSRLLCVSRKMARDLGFSDPAQLIGMTDFDLFGRAFGEATRLDDLKVIETGRPMIGVVESRRLANGRTNWTLTSKLPLQDESGKVIGLVGITREISETRETELALQHLATHDALTDLPNRFLLVDRLGQLLARAQRTSTTFAVLFMDIDRFKEVNDSRGHDVGDLLLSAFAQRLAKSVRKSDTVARIGGDEFVIILENLHDAAEAARIARKLQISLARPYTLEARKVKVSVSIGISFYPDNGRESEVLLRAADYAMYLVKRRGGNGYLNYMPGVPDAAGIPEQEA
jgi:diguanylate cyclase (GGDEF)-like protein/PAS domain S-box-containing protein